jgi:pimeloyl-ACP methyl ester carboxylesterase
VKELLALHEFESDNGLDGPEHQYAKLRPWRLKIVNEVIEGKDNKVFDFSHAFRAQDYQKPKPLHGFNHVSRPTTGAISWARKDSHAPLVVFSNSLLTDLHIWDPTIDELICAFPGFRFLRYNTRGYGSSSNEPVDVDVLADDLAGLLDSLGVQRYFAAVRVSLGGAHLQKFRNKISLTLRQIHRLR